MDLGYIAPCPVCGGEIKLYSHCGKPDCKAVCQSCKKGFPFHANLKTYAGTKIYASSIRKSVRMWNNTVSKEVIADDKEETLRETPRNTSACFLSCCKWKQDAPSLHRENGASETGRPVPFPVRSVQCGYG